MILFAPVAPMAHADDTGGGTEFDKKMSPVADEINRIGDNARKALAPKKKKKAAEAKRKKAEAIENAETNRDAADQP
jgi:hypothetical protein